jgi:hypothetical protein
MATSEPLIIVDEAASAAPRRGTGRVNMSLLLAERHQEVEDGND